MTETSILPGAAPSPESGIDMVPPGTGVEESGGGGDRRRLMILGAVVGLLVVVAAAYMLLHKGSSSSTGSFVPTSTHSAPAGPKGGTPSKGTSKGSSKHPGNGGVNTLPKKAKSPQVRDPFKPLVLAPVAGSGGSTTTTTVNAPTTPPVTQSNPPVTTQTTPPVQPTTPPPTTTGKGTTKGSPLWIQLMHVKGDRATFRVGYAQHKFRTFNVQAPKATSSHGTVFDKIFALIGIQNGSVTVQEGDDTPFDLPTGVSHAV